MSVLEQTCLHDTVLTNSIWDELCMKHVEVENRTQNTKNPKNLNICSFLIMTFEQEYSVGKCRCQLESRSLNIVSPKIYLDKLSMIHDSGDNQARNNKTKKIFYICSL